MKFFITVAALGAAAIALLPHSLVDRFFVQEAIGLFFLVILLAGRISSNHSWTSIPFFVYTAGYAIFDWQFPMIRFPQLGPMGAAQWGSATAGMLLTLLLFVSAALALEYTGTKIIPFLAGLAAIDSVVMIVRFFLYGRDQACLLSIHPSVDGSFVACMIPWFLSRSHMDWREGFVQRPGLSWVAIPMIAACLISHSSTAFAAIFVMSAAYCFCKFGWRSLIFIMPLAVCSLMLGHAILAEKLLQDDGRFAYWAMALRFFNTQPPLVGAGPGTYFLYGPALQIIEHVGETTILLWAHNDWLQILFEEGWIGLFLAVVCFTGMLRGSWKRPYLFSMVATYGFIGLTQMPLHLFFLQSLGVALVTESTRKEQLELVLAPESLEIPLAESTELPRKQAWPLRF